MKRVIRAAKNFDREPITELTEDEISGLPERVLVMTRKLGTTAHTPVFRIVTKSELSNPDECVLIDSYWGYASGRNVYLATKDEVREYYKEQIAHLEDEMNKYLIYAF